MEAVQRPGALGHQIFSSLGKQAQRLGCGLGIYCRQPFVARGGQRGCYGIDPIVLAGVASESRDAPAPKAWAVRPPPTRLRPPALPLDADRDHRRSPSLRATLGEALSPVFEGSQTGAVLREIARSTSSPKVSSIAAMATDALWGSTPMSTFMRARTSVSVGPPPPSSRAKDIPTSGGAPIPLLSHSARRGHRRDASREQANPPGGRQEVAERSLYDRYPRSLATLETTELPARVKQVGSCARSCKPFILGYVA